MSHVWGSIVHFGRFWYDFAVGDDWTIVAGVVILLGITFGLYRSPDVPAW